VRLIPPSDNSDPVAKLLAIVNDPFEHALRNLYDTPMVGITIQNQVDQNDKPIGNTLTERSVIRRRDMECVRKSLPVEFQIKRPGHVSRRRPFGQEARRFLVDMQLRAGADRSP